MMALGALGEQLGALRLHDAESQRQMQVSLQRHGQLSPVLVFGGGEHLEVVDGFKRLRAARELGWPELLTERMTVADRAQAKAAMALVNGGRGLHEMEEAWLVRSLYREDHLQQPQIGRLLCRHKSWVCRRLMLAECLADTVEADVRLGLLAARAATELARLPRGNQRAAADAVMARGLTVAQTARLVQAMQDCADENARAQCLVDAMNASAAPSTRGAVARARTHAEWVLVDIATITRTGARLQARLLQRPLSALGERAGGLVFDALLGLRPVLSALGRTIERVAEEEDHADVAQPGRVGPAGREALAARDEAAGDHSGGQREPQHGAPHP